VAQPPAQAAKLPSPSDSLVIVAGTKDDTANVFRVNGNTLELLKSLKTGGGPHEVCISADGKKAYVTNSTGGGITVIDLTTLEVGAPIMDASLERPTGLAASRDGKKLYVGSRGSQALVVLSTGGQVLKQLPVKDPTGVAISPDGTRVYVASDSTQSVFAIDTSTDTVNGVLKTGRQPMGIAVTPDSKTVLVASVSSDVMHVFNAATNELYGAFGIGRAPQGIAVAPDGKVAYSVTREATPGLGHSTVSILDLRQGYGRKSNDIAVDALPARVLLSPDASFLYVTCTGADAATSVTIIDLRTGETVHKVRGGAGARGMALRK
jgi:YVTN family beta-propeller protein